MDELENKVKKVKSANKKGGIIALIIAVVLVVIGIASTPNKENWKEFDVGERYKADSSGSWTVLLLCRPLRLCMCLDLWVSLACSDILSSLSKED